MCSRGGTWLSDARRDNSTSSQPPAVTASPQAYQVVDANHNSDSTQGPPKWMSAASSTADVMSSPTSPAVSELVDKGVTYLRDRIFNRDSGFEKLTPQNHLSAVETLRRSKPFSTPRSKFADNGPTSSDVGNASAQCSFSPSTDTAMVCCTAPRAVNGKRRLSTGRRDDSSSGCERQRKYFGNIQRSTGFQPNDTSPKIARETPLETNDSVISQYLSFKVEHMDLQSDKFSAEKPSSPKWIPCGKTEATNGDTTSERRMHDPDVIKSFTKYRHGPHEVHRNNGRRYRKPSGSRAGVLSRDVNYSARRKDDKRLESFFSQMGMDSQTLSATLAGSPTVSTFENVSSIDTSTLESRTSYAESERVGEAVLDSFDVNDRDTVVSSSVVERNARIIKWLCSIRKASASDDVQFDEGFV